MDIVFYPNSLIVHLAKMLTIKTNQSCEKHSIFIKRLKCAENKQTHK